MKIGIAFAGGGVRGAAHLGILQALEENGIVGDAYAGTSAGSIVAAMKALGHDNETCKKMIEEAGSHLIDVAYWDILCALPNKFKTLNGVFKGEKLKQFFIDHMGESFLMNTKHGLSIISTDINTGAQVVFSSENIRMDKIKKIDDHVDFYGRLTPLSIPHIVYASCALPGIFKPLRYGRKSLVDGSITNNLPANVAKLMGVDKVIAIDLAKRNPCCSKVEGLYDILSQATSVMVSQNTHLSMAQTKEVYRLNPDLTDIGLLDFKRTEECYDAGYRYGKRIAPALKEALNKNT